MTAALTPPLINKDFQNWLKGSLSVLFAKEGLIDLVENKSIDFQGHLLQTVYTQKGITPGTTCGSCTTANVLACPTEGFCSKGKRCKAHDSKVFKKKPNKACPNGLCSHIRDAFKNKHRFKGPSWKNTDARKWCSDAFELSKCFLPPECYSDKACLPDTDFNGILAVVINNNRFQRKISVNLGLEPNICTEDTCDSSAMFRRIHYGAKSTTPHEVDVNEEMNIVSLRSKQPISYILLEFLIDFCNLTKQKKSKTAQQLSIQEIGNTYKDMTDLKEIELSRQEVTDSIHRDRKVDDNTLINTLPAATANNLLMKNITVVERNRFVFPQIVLDEYADVKVATPTNSGRRNIVNGEQKEQMSNGHITFQTFLDLEKRRLRRDTQLKLTSDYNHPSFQNPHSEAKSSEEQFKDLKYKVVTSISYKTEKEVVRRYSKPIELRNKLWPAPFDETGEIIRRLTEIPQPQLDINYARKILEVFFVFEPLMNIVDQIALGRPPAPHVSMRYELLRFCTLRSYPKEDKPYLIKLAEAGFYYASDGDGVVCYCCGIRRYNWTADDQPMKIHKRVNPTCKFLIKNEEVNVRNNFNGPFSKILLTIDSIPEPVESQEPSEDVNNDWARERTRSPAPRAQNNQSTGSSNQLGINTAIPKHSQYATKTQRLASFNGWPDTASHTPDVLADAGFFYAG